MARRGAADTSGGKCVLPLALTSLQGLCAGAAAKMHPDPASEGGAWQRTQDQRKSRLNEDEDVFVPLLFDI